MPKSEINKMKVNTVFKFSWLVLCFIFSCGMALAQTTAFTYQGKLNDMSIAANGQYDLIFRLFDSAEGGGQIDGAAACNGVASGSQDSVCEDVVVTGGIFTVNLSFGEGAFINGEQRFLEIHVRPGASTGEHTQLTPRQEITSSPFSVKSLRSAAADSLSASCILCVTDAKIQSIDASKLTGILPITSGGTGSSTKNFVDLFSNQSVFGNKTFNNGVTFNSGVTLNQSLTINGSLDVPNGIVSADQFHGNGDGLVNVPGTFKWQAVSGLKQQALPNWGYMATSETQVAVTLPQNLRVGDTVRISGSGSGGWRITQNEEQSIIGINVGLAGSLWTPRENNRSWLSVATSSDGRKLVAVADGGQIYTSGDAGSTWTPRESNRNWGSVASSADGTKLIACGYGASRCYLSTDSGVNWVPDLFLAAWTSVAASADGSTLVAVGLNQQIWVSTSGGSFQPRESSRQWSAVASSADGTKLVATVDNGLVYTSGDSGATWTPRATNQFWRAVASSADGTKLLAATNTSIFTSNDSGLTWATRGPTLFWRSVNSSADGVRLAAVAGNERIYISSDSGATWTQHESQRAWRAIACSADCTRLVAVVSEGQIYTSIPETTRGTAGYLTGEQFSSIELQYIGNGQFLPISHSGRFSGF
jgi:hypothetical protein